MAQMERRALGRSGIEVSALGLGCWAIGGPTWAGPIPIGWGEVDDAESVRAIRRAIELGVTFFDTADVYGAGHSERVLGRAVAAQRDRLVLATKFGLTFDEENRRMTGFTAEPEAVRTACEASLRRLNTDHIDLYQFHWGECEVERALPVRDALERLVDEGKIGAYAWSTNDPERAAAFARGAHCAAVQHSLNVLSDQPAMLALCEQHRLASICRSPLAMGLLTGKYGADSQLGPDDVRSGAGAAGSFYFQNGRPKPEWLAKLGDVRDVLTSGGRTLAQGALAWVWGRGANTVPIPGFRTVRQVEENAGALALDPLPDDQMRRIDRLLQREPAPAP